MRNSLKYALTSIVSAALGASGSYLFTQNGQKSSDQFVQSPTSDYKIETRAFNLGLEFKGNLSLENRIYIREKTQARAMQTMAEFVLPEDIRRMFNNIDIEASLKKLELLKELKESSQEDSRALIF